MAMKKKSVWLLLCVVSALLCLGCGKETNTNQEEVRNTPIVTAQPSPSFGTENEKLTPTPTQAVPLPDVLVASKDMSIWKLCNAYQECKNNGGLEDLKPLVNTMEEADTESIFRLSEYTVSHDNLTCYAVPMSGEIAYVVYMVFDLHTTISDVPVPMMTELYLTQTEDGLRIFFGDIERSVYDNVVRLRDSSAVERIALRVDTAYAEALEADERLEVFRKLLEQ